MMGQGGQQGALSPWQQAAVIKGEWLMKTHLLLTRLETPSRSDRSYRRHRQKPRGHLQPSLLLTRKKGRLCFQEQVSEGSHPPPIYQLISHKDCPLKKKKKDCPLTISLGWS